jgi:hypothetical protein
MHRNALPNKLLLPGNHASILLRFSTKRIPLPHPVPHSSGHFQLPRQVRFTRVKITIRMRNPKDNFSVYFPSEESKELFCNHIQAVMDYLHEHPFGEYQLKNFIRYTMNISNISNILNDFQLSNVLKLNNRKMTSKPCWIGWKFGWKAKKWNRF